MIDLHTHTLLSDGELLPLELARRAKVKGYTILGISDHVDVTTIENVASSILKLNKYATLHEGIRVMAGAELTHCPAKQIGELTMMARRLGFSYVVVHGETIAEPVEEGTNAAAIEAGVDILAHPGLITEKEVEAAKKARRPAGDQHKKGTFPLERSCGEACQTGGGKACPQYRLSQPVGSRDRR